MEGPAADLWESAKRNDLSRLSHLLQGGEDANQRDDRGLTPLHVAATFGALEAAQLLLLHGADTSASDWESGWTPLHRSFYFGHVKLSLLLLKHGAKLGDEFEGDWRRDLSMNRPTNRSIRNCRDWDIHDHDGNTPLDLLCEHLKVYLQQNIDGAGQNNNRKKARAAQARAMDVCNSEVFTFGKADFQLGIPLPKASSEIARPRRIDDLLSLPVCVLAAAKYHSMALTANGQVYSWGHGRTGRLGHGDEHVRPSPTLIAGLAKKKVIKISAGENHSAAVTAEGDLYTWGSDRFGQLGHGNNSGGKHCFAPRKVDALRRYVVTDVAAGSAHTIAAAADAEVYTWGLNKDGQLGLREMDMSSNPCPTPRLVHFSAVNKGNQAGAASRRRKVQVAAGSINCLVNFIFMEQGRSEVFQWGWTVSSPQRVTVGSTTANGLVELNGVFFHATPLPYIAQVAAGKFHNVALTAFGEVYTWGIGSDVLGHGPSETYATKPQLVEALLPENGGGKVIHISASPNRTCAVTDTGEVFSWGVATEPGVLGNGSTRYQPMPKRVVGVQRAVSACVAEDHTLVLLRTSVPPLPHVELFAAPQQQQHEAAAVSARQAQKLPAAPGAIHWSFDQQPVDSDSIHFPEMFDMDEDIDPVNHEREHHQSSSLPRAEPDGDISARGPFEPPSLVQICEHALAKQIDTKNAVSLLTNAEMLSSDALVQFSAEYIRRNFDAILVLGKQSDIDLLLEEVGEQVHAKLAGSIQTPPDLSALKLKLARLPSSSPQTPAKPLAPLDPVALQKAIKAAKKRLATIELLEQQLAAGKDLLPEQLEKIQRKAAVQKEIESLEQRLKRAEKEQELREAARTARSPEPAAQEDEPQAAAPAIALREEPAAASTPPSKGRRKFVSLDEHEQRMRSATTTQQAAPVVAASPAAPESVGQQTKPVAKAWGTPNKLANANIGVNSSSSSSPIAISAPAGRGASSSASQAQGGPRPSPVQQQQLQRKLVPQTSSPASSPSSTQISLAAFLSAKPKHKVKKSEPEGLSASPSERGWNIATATTAAASPTTRKTLLEIQQEEERTRIESVPVHHSGNDSAWFVERRRRAGSMESIMEEQEAIAAVERFERMEQERLKREQEAQQREREQQHQQHQQRHQRKGSHGRSKPDGESGGKPRSKPKPPKDAQISSSDNSEQRAAGAAPEAKAGEEKKRRYKPRNPGSKPRSSSSSSSGGGGGGHVDATAPPS